MRIVVGREENETDAGFYQRVAATAGQYAPYVRIETPYGDICPTCLGFGSLDAVGLVIVVGDSYCYNCAVE